MDDLLLLTHPLRLKSYFPTSRGCKSACTSYEVFMVQQYLLLKGAQSFLDNIHFPHRLNVDGFGGLGVVEYLKDEDIWGDQPVSEERVFTPC